MGVRKLKPKPEINLPPVSKAKLKELIEEAVVDAYNEGEQTVGFFTIMQEHLALPFCVNILGIQAVVEKVDMTRDGGIVAICRLGEVRQKIESSICHCQRPHRQVRNGLQHFITGAEGFR